MSLLALLFDVNAFKAALADSDTFLIFDPQLSLTSSDLFKSIDKQAGCTTVFFFLSVKTQSCLILSSAQRWKNTIANNVTLHCFLNHMLSGTVCVQMWPSSCCMDLISVT